MFPSGDFSLWSFCLVDGDPYDFMIEYENRHKNVNLSYFIKVYLYVLYLPFEIVNFWSSGILKFLGGYGVEGLSGQDRACWRKRPPWGAFTAGDFFYVCLMLYDCDADLEGVKENY